MKEGEGDRDYYLIDNVSKDGICVKPFEIFGDIPPGPQQCNFLYKASASLSSVSGALLKRFPGNIPTKNSTAGP